jgi:hypothetical protein
MFVSYLRQVGGYLQVHPFPTPIKLTATILNKSWVLGLHVRRWEGIVPFKPAVGKLIKQIIPLNNYNYLERNL